MNTPLKQPAHEDTTSSYPEMLELWDPAHAALTPQKATRMWLQASRWLTRAQQDFHDAIFSRDGSEESLDRFASARAELDSAEAWALRVAKALQHGVRMMPELSSQEQDAGSGSAT